MRIQFCPASSCNAPADPKRMLCPACLARLSTELREAIERDLALYNTAFGAPMVKAINWLNTKDRDAA